MICPKCGTENVDDARFCTECGSSMDATGDVRRPITRDREEQMCFGISGGVFPLIIGVIIVMVGVVSAFGRDFGYIIGTWGADFGMSMGRWGERVGRFFAEWGTTWGSRIGASISIIIGLAIIYFFMDYSRRR
jgi:hypothetical protein